MILKMKAVTELCKGLLLLSEHLEDLPLAIKLRVKLLLLDALP